jgi:hypothetical protein
MHDEEYKKKFIESDVNTPRIFLVCTEDGGVVDITCGTNFEKVYESTVGCNHGELIIELAQGNYEDIVKIAKQLGWEK